MLSLENVSFSFGSNRKLLNECSMKIEQGINVLMGPNGAGKSTLFNIITGFLKPRSGDILYNGISVTSLPPFKINRLGIGRTFQDLRLITKLSVLDNIRLAIKDNPTDKWYNSFWSHKTHTAKLIQLDRLPELIAKEYYLADVMNNMAGSISYGQQKLLTIACCVANDADLLLLDEPVAGINPVYRQHMIAILQKLKAAGKTILLIEHNTEFIDEVADEILFLSGGKISSFRNLDEMRMDAAVMESYL